MLTIANFLEKLNAILLKPGMYNVQKVEDINIIFTSEIIIHQNENVEKWSSEFRQFVIADVDERLSDFHWSNIIRLYSGSDSHSIELFKQLCEKFSKTCIDLIN